MLDNLFLMCLYIAGIGLLLIGITAIVEKKMGIK